jgi:hypothetical protein
MIRLLFVRKVLFKLWLYYLFDVSFIVSSIATTFANKSFFSARFTFEVKNKKKAPFENQPEY